MCGSVRASINGFRSSLTSSVRRSSKIGPMNFGELRARTCISIRTFDGESKLEDTKGKVNFEVLKSQAALTGWNIVKRTAELSRILAEVTKGRAKGAAMACEQDTDCNGSGLDRDWAVEHLDGSKKATVALGVKITDPPMVFLQELEARAKCAGGPRSHIPTCSNPCSSCFSS